MNPRGSQANFLWVKLTGKKASVFWKPVRTRPRCRSPVHGQAWWMTYYDDVDDDDDDDDGDGGDCAQIHHEN